MNRRVKMIGVALSLLMGAGMLSLSIWNVGADGGSRALIERLSGWTNNAATHGSRTTAPTPLAPTITANKTDSLLTDVNGNGKADPGDTLKYTVTIGASGMDATGVTFNDTPDANTTLVPGSVMTTPLAGNDSYSASGNIQLTIAAPGVLANDVDPDGVGPALTVSAGTTTTNGGNLTLSANGGFTYNPPPGFEGVDTFTYTLNDGEGNTDTATAAITVTGMIWFVNNSLGSNGDGRLSAPFNSLANFVAGAADDPGDNIFIYSGAGNYTGPLTLLNNQKLIGQGAGDTLSNIAGVTPPAGSLSLPATGGARPVIAASGANLTLASGNTLRGFNLSNTGGTALSGLNFGALTVAEVSVSNTNGVGINLDNGAPNASFTSVNTSGGGNGIVLQNWASGSFTITGSGGSCAAATPTCTGGVIQNTTGPNTTAVPPTGAGIALNNVTNISLNNVRVRDHSNYGIRGVNVTGFTLNNSLIDATAPGFNGDDPANDDGSIYFTNLLGACGITSSDIRRGLENLLQVDNTGGSLTLNISNSNFQETSLSLGPVVGNAGINLMARMTAVMTVNITNTSIHDVLTDCVFGRAQDNGALSLTATDCALLDSDQAFDLAVTQNADLNYDIQNNTMTGHTQNALQVVIGEVSNLSNVSGKIIGNTIGGAAAVDSGSELGFGINMDLRGNGTSSTTIHNNIISHTDREGIFIVTRGESSASIKTGQHAMRITNNTINAPDDNSPFSFGNINGLSIETNNGQTFCLNISGNTSSPAASGFSQRDGYRLRQRSQGAASVFQIQGLTPASGATDAQVQSYMQSINTGTCFVVPASGTNIVAYTAGACSTPAPLAGPTIDTISLAEKARAKVAKVGALSPFIKTVGELLAAYGEGSGIGVANLSDIDLNHIRQAALVRLSAAGISGEEVARLASLSFQISDLPEGVLATASSAGVVIDVNAAGHGWYIDLSPNDDQEFLLGSGNGLRVKSSNPVFRQMDLLTVVMREMVHLLGQENRRQLNYLDGLMSRTLTTGLRRLPSTEQERISRLIQPGGESGANRISSSFNSAPAQPMRRIHSAFSSPVAYTRPELYFNAASAPAAKPASAMAPVSLNIGRLPAGKSITITFNVTINNSVTTTQVCNQGLVSGSNFSDALTNDPDTAAPNDSTCTPLANANLALTKSAGSATICAGSNITYTINFSNSGPDAAGNLTVGDATPANTTFVSAAVTTGAGWGVAAPAPGGTGAITFSKPSVTNGETAVFQIVVNVDSGVANNTVISNAATAASTTIDGNLADNTSSASVTVKQTPTATAGPDQMVVPNGVSAPLGGNTPPSGATGTWSVVGGGTGPFSNVNDPNATFTHTGGAGPITLRWTVANSPCAAASEDVIITVGSAPIISCPAPITVNAPSGQCSAPVAFNVTATGAPSPSVVCKIGSTVITSPYTFPLGVTTVSCEATNGIAPDAACGFTVTVNDAQAPTITTCASNKTLATNGAAQIALPDFTGEIVASDTCSAVTVTQSPAPGTMIGLGNTTVTFTVKDAANNPATCSAVVTVVGFGLGGFVVFGEEATELRPNARIVTGDIGANTSLPDPDGPPDDKIEVELASNARMLQSGSRVIGDTVKLGPNASVYNVSYNELINTFGSILGAQSTPLGLPVSILPALPAITPGAQDVTVNPNQTLALAPGSYRNVTVGPNGKLNLAGGLYQIASLTLQPNAQLNCQAATEVRIKNALSATTNAFIGPAASAPGLLASQIVFFVEGGNPVGGSAADVSGTVKANIYAPTGTVNLRPNTNATGAFIGKRVIVGDNAEVRLQSVF
jgi:uncharacterized repeat protein (TIGR01451 family)